MPLPGRKCSTAINTNKIIGRITWTHLFPLNRCWYSVSWQSCCCWECCSDPPLNSSKSSSSPAAFIGGIIGLVLVSTGLVGASTDLLETFAYHLFIISFISLGLTTNFKKDSQFSAISPVKGSLWMGFVSGVVMAMQAIIGALFVFLFNAAGFELHPTFGFLSPLGFTQGPGQALSIGRVWQDFGFENAATLGLSFAVFGFAFAFFVGVPLVNWGIRKGYSTEAPRSYLVIF